MALFELPQRDLGRDSDSSIAKKTKARAKATTQVKGGGNSIDARIAQIKAMVESHLGKYKDETLLITDVDTLEKYIDDAIINGEIAIDTETNGLDPLLDDIVGVCIYTPNHKTAYIPINHVSYFTNVPLKGQIDREVVAEQIRRVQNIKIIMFNATFDTRVIRHSLGVDLVCYWDGYIGARLLNENEGDGNNGLKQLHQKYVLNGVGDAFSFGALFDGIKFSLIPPNVGYLYAAHDAIITYELYKFQEEYLGDNAIHYGLQDVAWVFRNIEMPCAEVVSHMEDNGIEFDFAYNEELKVKYHKILEERNEEFNKVVDECCGDKLRAYAQTHDDIEIPVNIKSSSQLATLLYQIAEIEPVIDKKTKKPIYKTDKNVLAMIKHPIVDAITSYREFSTIVSTFIDKLPNCVNPNDGRIHCKFNQYGADTGRFSSNNPNLQNIPSHVKDIRKMFKATDGYVLMSSDYSQQEPKCLAALCRKQGDSQMYDTFMQGKDLYSEIASKAFHYPYEECKEFRPDGTTNKEGKARRSQAKSILLGVLYGRGTASIAEQLHTSVEEATDIKESVFRGFPAIKQFEEESLDMARDVGYVTTVCGRKRRLPSLQLPEFEFDWEDGFAPDGDILDFDDCDIEVPMAKCKFYYRKLQNAYGKKKKQEIVSEALREHIVITDNGGKIADATRQCVNARIQGSAADLTKLAMIELYKNARLKELGFKILIPVHDELICECPIEHAKECSELLAQTMSIAAERILEMPIKCDVEVTKCWYGDPIDGSELKVKETNTSHGIDEENIRDLQESKRGIS